MIPLTSDAADTLRTYLGELERDLQSADSDIRETVQRERDTLQIILGRKRVTAEDLDLLETLRDYAEDEAEEIEQEAKEDGIDLDDLPDDDPTFERYLVLLERLRTFDSFLAIFGLTQDPGQA